MAAPSRMNTRKVFTEELSFTPWLTCKISDVKTCKEKCHKYSIFLVYAYEPCSVKSVINGWTNLLTHVSLWGLCSLTWVEVFTGPFSACSRIHVCWSFKVVSWRSLMHLCVSWLSHTSIDTTLLSKATDDCSHMIPKK